MIGMTHAVTAWMVAQEDTSTTTTTIPPDTSGDTSEPCGSAGALCDQVYEWTGNEDVAEATSWLLVTPLTILLIIVIALVVNRIGRKWSARFVNKLGRETEQHDQLVSDRSAERATMRAETMGFLLKGLVSAVVFFIATILIMESLGIDIIAAIASASVLALAIGFGAQSVVADLFAGLFMLAEDQLGVGDRVDVGPVNGYVVRVTPRTTVIRDSGGQLWHIPNSQIDYVANETQSWSRATVIIPVSYGEDIQAATRTLLDAATDLVEDDAWSEGVVEPPVAQAGQDLGDGVDIRVYVHVDPDRRRALERALRVRFVEALNEEGIAIPNAALDVFMKD